MYKRKESEILTIFRSDTGEMWTVLKPDFLVNKGQNEISYEHYQKMCQKPEYED